LEGRDKWRGRREQVYQLLEKEFLPLSLYLSRFLFVAYSDRIGTVSSPQVKPQNRFRFVFIGLKGQLFKRAAFS
jgi:hypothetical protein